MLEVSYVVLRHRMAHNSTIACHKMAPELIKGAHAFLTSDFIIATHFTLPWLSYRTESSVLDLLVWDIFLSVTLGATFVSLLETLRNSCRQDGEDRKTQKQEDSRCSLLLPVELPKRKGIDERSLSQVRLGYR